MTTFLDGPASGQIHMLRRSPILLRVVEANGKFDALDQIDDEPSPAEKLYAYEMEQHLGNMHIRASGGHSGFYASCKYKLCAPQPTDAEMRHTWAAWCETQRPRIHAEKPQLLK